MLIMVTSFSFCANFQTQLIHGYLTNFICALRKPESRTQENEEKNDSVFSQTVSSIFYTSKIHIVVSKDLRGFSALHKSPNSNIRCISGSNVFYKCPE